MKKKFSNELAYVLGNIFVAIGVALMEKSDFGVSMVVAPAYLVYRKLSQTLTFFTFGMAEYTLQAVLLMILCLYLRRFKLSYLFSFITAVFYGLILDAVMLPAAFLPSEGIAVRAIWYVLGMLSCSLGISMMFHTYISPEVYELFVKEASEKCGMEIHRFKQRYDCTSCLVGVVLSFAFFGLWHFEGVKLGTIFCALINGPIIGFFSSQLEKRFDFCDTKPWRQFFEK